MRAHAPGSLGLRSHGTRLGGAGIALLLTVLATLTALVPWALADEPGANAMGPRVGDRALYAIHRHDTSEPVGSFTFTWTGRTTVPDAFGVPRAVDVANAVRVVDGAYQEETYRFHADTTHLVSVTVEHPERYRESEPLVAVDVHHTREVTSYDKGSAWACLARAEWHAGQDATRRAVSAVCPAARGTVASGPSPRFVQRASAQGGGAHVLAADAGPLRGVTLHPDVPYPVEARIVHEDEVLTLRLQGLARGAEADASRLDARAPAAPPARPEAQFGAVGRWGFLEGDGSAFPYPPTEALSHVLRDPWREDVRAYLREHPEARIVAYRYSESRHTWGEHAGTWPTWRFVFNDAHGNGLVVDARRPPATNAAPGLELPAGTLHLGESDRVRLHPLDAATLPPTTVALSDAVAAWRLTADGRDAVFNHVDAVLQPELRESAREAERATSWDVTVGFIAYDAMMNASASSVARYDTRRDVDFARIDLATARLVDVTRVGVERTRVPDFAAAPPGAFHDPPPDLSEDTIAGLVLRTAGVTLAALFAYHLRLLGGAFYSRIDRGNVLAHETRDKLLRIVERSPGLHARALARAADVRRGTARYHLRILVRASHVTTRRDGGYVRYFPAGVPTAEATARGALLGGGSHGRVFELVRTHDGLSQSQIAERLDLTPPAVHYVVRKLERAGLVKRTRHGRLVRVHAVRDAASERGGTASPDASPPLSRARTRQT